MSEWLTLAHDLYHLQQLLKRTELKADKLRAQLLDLSDHKSHSESNYILERCSRLGAIDYTSIPILKELGLEYLESYRKPDVIVWKLHKTDG